MFTKLRPAFTKLSTARNFYKEIFIQFFGPTLSVAGDSSTIFEANKN